MGGLKSPQLHILRIYRRNEFQIAVYFSNLTLQFPNLRLVNICYDLTNRNGASRTRIISLLVFTVPLRFTIKLRSDDRVKVTRFAAHTFFRCSVICSNHPCADKDLHLAWERSLDTAKSFWLPSALLTLHTASTFSATAQLTGGNLGLRLHFNAH